MAHTVRRYGSVSPVAHTVRRYGSVSPMAHTVRRYGSVSPVAHAVRRCGSVSPVAHAVRRYNSEPISRTIRAASQATTHCQTTTQAAHFRPSSRLTEATAATQGV